MRILGTAGPDFGTVAVTLDGRNVLGHDLRPLLQVACRRRGSLELGTHQLGAGPHALRLTSVGKNPASKGFSFGVDAVDLIAVRAETHP